MSSSHEIIFAFLHERRGKIRSKATRESYVSNLGACDEYLGGVTLLKAKPAQLSEWCTSPRIRDGMPVSPNTVRIRKSILTVFFDWAVRTNRLSKSPMLSIEDDIGGSSKATRPGVWLEPARVAKILAGIGHPDPVMEARDRALVTFGFATGLRRKELGGLKWWQFDLDATQPTLTLARDEKSGDDRTGKGEKPATVYLFQNAVEAIEKWRTVWVEHAGREPESDDGVFPRFRTFATEDNREGEATLMWQPIWGSALQKAGVSIAVRKVSERSGVRFRCHDMRRTFAGILDDAGMNVQDISSYMRHENIDTTQKYLERRPGKVAERHAGMDLGF